MISVTLAALMICAAISSSWRFLDSTVSILSIRWIAFFGLMYFEDEVLQAAFRAWLSIPPALLLGFSAFGFLIFILGQSWSKQASKRKEASCVARNKHGEDDSIFRPLMFPSRTTHTRFFPKKHSFSYSYLLVGIPIGWRGVVNSFLSADLQNECSLEDATSKPAWFQVNAADYLERGGSSLGLRGKLEKYLKSQVGRISSGLLLMLRTCG